MLKRIVLENFMSHGRSEIDLAGGLTVLVGPNNCGKSAVVEALRVVCTNVPSEVVVRHGAKVCRVTVETDDGHTVTWQRKGATVSYEIDGRPVNRLGKGGVPDDLHEILKLPKVDAPGGEFDIHFGLQKEPIFLIDEPGSRIASFFSVSSDAEKLMRMQGKHREKVRNAKQRKKEFEEEIVQSGKLMEAMQPLVGLGGEIEKVEAEYKGLKELEGDIKTLAGVIEDVEKYRSQVAYFDARGKVLDRATPPPAMENVSALEMLIVAKTRATAKIGEANAAIAVLARVDDVPRLDDVSALERVVREISRLGRGVAVLEALHGWHGQLRPAPEVRDVAPFASAIEQIERKRADAAALRAAVVLTEQEIAAVEEQMRQWAGRHPLCPVCGGDVDPDRMLGREHSHA